MSFQNLQSPEKPVDNVHGFIDFISVFDTIQGEGPFAGRPAVFIRLAGCNIQCKLCDTQYTEGRRQASAVEIADEVYSLRKKGLVVITGGEPMRQARIGDLVMELWRRNYITQIETNGTLFHKDFPWLPKQVSIVCSPKTARLSKNIWPYLHCLKYVVQAGKIDEEDGLPTEVLGMPLRVARPEPNFNGEIYIQPCDEQEEEKNKANLDTAKQVCFKYGYRLSIQTHKALGLP